jgi:hypothetical protein
MGLEGGSAWVLACSVHSVTGAVIQCMHFVKTQKNVHLIFRVQVYN